MYPRTDTIGLRLSSEEAVAADQILHNLEDPKIAPTFSIPEEGAELLLDEQQSMALALGLQEAADRQEKAINDSSFYYAQTFIRRRLKAEEQERATKLKADILQRIEIAKELAYLSMLALGILEESEVLASHSHGAA